ncbi:Putative PX-associated domain-containing protein [Septoria linicola]|uniref:PX-associated domain-containing protein n=1 Tax=Septoria linicola TaxID=215465 RepID=A0A9Q9EGM1_9PEZI|nr:Putative PX-associated domain-containing protein [Septoria linicola]
MSTTKNDGKLSAAQSKALFDILTHQQVYKEIEDFKYPGAIHNYGPPFQDTVKSPQSPILQALVSKFLLKLPGLRDVSPEFWRGRIQPLIDELAEAELSESYDKGILGIRKTLATAISALIEYPARGVLGGFPKEEVKRSAKYDLTNPDDVLQSWKDCVQKAVYGDLIDELFTKAAETDDLTKHDSLVQGMHEFMVVNIASIMHYTLILSPEGATMLRMLSSVHNLIPYTIIRQTLKVGNVATMLSGVMRIVLAKASVATVTNWIGLSSGADEGMNLLQQIISQVLGWDKRELKKRAEKIEKAKDGPPKDVLAEIRDWIGRSRAEHEETRRRSQEQNMSIVAVILALSSVSSELSEAQHAKAQEYLSLQLAVRDRQQIVKAMCQRNPDILTAAIRDAVDAYTPMIRYVHQAVNLSDTLWDFERFLTDMLKISMPNDAKKEQKPPSVEDFVDLLHRHQSSCHKFLHQFAKNGKEMTEWWKEYVHMAAANFRREDKPPSSESLVADKMTTGGLQDALEKAFADLSASDQKAVQGELDAWKKYIDELHDASTARISSVIKRTQATPFGPGAYLARWQQLLDDTPITPSTAKGPVRHGSDKSVKEESRADIEGNDNSLITEEQAQKAVGDKLPTPPRCKVVSKLLWPKFNEALASSY